MQIPVYNMEGQLTDERAVDEAQLGGTPNYELIRQAVLTYEANRRVGCARTKTRAGVSRSRRKPFRQKGTGRARQGDSGSPVLVGGGRAHGARLRNFRMKISRKARGRALASAFLAKAMDEEIIALSELELQERKTRAMAAVLRRLGAKGTFLIVLPEYDADLWRLCRNIRGAAMMSCHELNTYELIRPSRVIFTVQALEQFLTDATRENRSVKVSAGDSADE